MIAEFDFRSMCLGISGPTVSVRPRLTVRRIQETVASYYRLPVIAMQSSRRHRSYARPRQVAMYFARELAHKTYPDIGEKFGRDHTTVIHAVRQVEKLRANDPDFDCDVKVLHERLTGGQWTFAA